MTVKHSTSWRTSLAAKRAIARSMSLTLCPGSSQVIENPSGLGIVLLFVCSFTHYLQCIVKLWSNIIYFNAEQSRALYKIHAGSVLFYLSNNAMSFMIILTEFYELLTTTRQYLGKQGTKHRCPLYKPNRCDCLNIGLLENFAILEMEQTCLPFSCEIH